MEKSHSISTEYNSTRADDFEWAERSEYWRTCKPVGRRGPPKKFKYREPLILCGHGARVRVDRGTLFVRDGFTHYPQKADETRFFPGDPNLPDRIVMLDGSGSISFDAIAWMSDQNIQFVKLNWRGEISCVSGNTGYSANPQLVDIQREIRGTSKSLEIAQWLVREKIEQSVKSITEIIPQSENRATAISRLKKWHSELVKSTNAKSLSQIHGIEGAAAAAYFQAWQGISLKWKGEKRRPIPTSWHEIGPRKMGWRKSGQNARHPINAMLNYGYGILVGQLGAQVLAAGLDPSIGVMHGTSQNRIPLVYDLIEPLRPVVDRYVLSFALLHTFTPGDFSINEFGGCRLNPQMAKAVVKEMPSFQEASKLTQQLVTLLRRVK